MKVITRRIEVTRVDYKVLGKEVESPVITEVFAGKTLQQIFNLLRKEHGKDTIVSILHTETSLKKYRMPVEDFIQWADVVEETEIEESDSIEEA